MSMSNTEKTVKDIRRNTRRESINPNLYYRWSKDFREAGKKRLSDARTSRRLLRR